RYLALPVTAAAAAHIVVLRLDLLRGLKVPLDLGLAPRGCRLFGENKTWRGALVMVVGSAVAMAVQQRPRAPALLLFDYGAVNAWPAGAPPGLGFVPGRLPPSLLKRRGGVGPGGQAEGARYWLFTALDQVDSVLGGLLALALVWPPPLPVVLAAVVLCSLAHVGFNLVFVWAGL